MDDTIIATIELTDTLVVEVPAAQGPPGLAGPPGTGTFTLTAGATLSGHRLLTTDSSGNAIYADSTVLSCANCVIGLSLGAAALNASVEIQPSGEVTDPSFSYTPGQLLWLGTNGLLVTAAPTTGFVLIVGYAVSATTIFLNIGQPIILL